MLPLLQRTGFDAVLLRADQSARCGAARAAASSPATTRATSYEPRPLFARSEAAASERDRSLRPRRAPASTRGSRTPSALLQRRGREHAGRIVQATSLGAEDMVLTDLIARHALPIAIGTLETGKLHAETLALIPRIEQRYGVQVEVYRPRARGGDPLRRAARRRRDVPEHRAAQGLLRHAQARAAGAHAGRRARPGSPACAASSRDNRGDGAVQRTRRRTAASSSTRWPTGPGATSGTTSPRTTCRTTRCTTEFMPEHRLRAVHPRDRRRRGLPRRPLVVGGRSRQGMRPARQPKRDACRHDDRSRRMNAPRQRRPPAARARPPPPRLAGGRGDLHPARGRGHVRAPGAAVLRRQGFVRRAAPGREGLQDAVAGNGHFEGKLPFPLLHVDTGHNFPEVIEFRDQRVAEMGERLVVGHLEDSIAARHGAPGAPARIAQRPPDGDAARGDRGAPLRRADRRRAARRGEGARQGAHLQPPRQLRPMAAEGAAARAVDAVQHAHQARASTSAPSRSATGPSSTSGSTSRARHIPLPSLYYAHERDGDPAQGPAGAGDRRHAAARPARRSRRRRCAFAPSAT